MNTTNVHIPELLFEVGTTQVFHYPSLKQKADNSMPVAVYWQNTVTKSTYGPFNSIYSAMTHHTWMLTQERQQARTDAVVPSNVIEVDFKAKSRIIRSPV
jgi:hypothetical protein